jgi:hypothetical protein
LDLEIKILPKDCLNDFCVNGIEGEIRIGHYRETLYIPLDWWDIATYESQWKQAIDRLRYHDTSCLVVAINNPYKRCYIEWWLLYKINNKIYIQNHIIINEVCSEFIGNELFTQISCYDFIPERGASYDEQGNKISEWVVDWDENG